ncbi:MAG TPA: MOSC N-terminal beta barrel domain-containing protein [Miltoncostaea sp.]|nr:MOSC N-terminal beta barrel domain-containing protein [Miltoncostaea sp.]
MTAAPHVAGIWRHPVKSLRGEALEAAEITPVGVAGDRCWGVRDLATGRILTGRREPRLLMAASRLGDDGLPVITLPDGAVLDGLGPGVDAALSGWLGHDVALVAAEGDPGARAEFFEDATDDASRPLEFTMPPGRFVDAMPLHLLTLDSLRAGRALNDGDWDVARFRPNLLIEAGGDGWTEDGWLGRDVRVGAVGLRVEEGCTRCTMITRPQPGLPDDRDVFRAVARHHAARFGVLARVTAPGVISRGDPVEVGPGIKEA